MAIDQKEIAKYLFDAEQSFETIDAFKDALNARFVSREVAAEDEEIKNKVTGKVLGALETKMKREFGLTEEEVRGKKVSELIELAGVRVKSNVEALTAELEAAKKGSNGTEEIAKLQSDLNAAKLRAKENEDLATANATKLEEATNIFAKEKGGILVGYKLEQIKASIPWAESANEYTRKGFDFAIKENYIFEEENGELIVTDKTGNRIQNEKKTGFIKPDELLKSEADKAGLLKKASGAPGANQPIRQYTPASNTGNGRQPHPNYKPRA